jgi:hypothetical protein
MEQIVLVHRNINVKNVQDSLPSNPKNKIITEYEKELIDKLLLEKLCEY